MLYLISSVTPSLLRSSPFSRMAVIHTAFVTLRPTFSLWMRDRPKRGLPVVGGIGKSQSLQIVATLHTRHRSFLWMVIPQLALLAQPLKSMWLARHYPHFLVKLVFSLRRQKKLWRNIVQELPRPESCL